VRIARVLLVRNGRNLSLAKYQFRLSCRAQDQACETGIEPCCRRARLCRNPHLLLTSIKYLENMYATDLKGIFEIFRGFRGIKREMG
jgi:hypothetical protein